MNKLWLFLGIFPCMVWADYNKYADAEEPMLEDGVIEESEIVSKKEEERQYILRGSNRPRVIHRDAEENISSKLQEVDAEGEEVVEQDDRAQFEEAALE